ncbi:MAG: MBOAT family protein [Clostridia bacterium]|nr:MBOAT family protein [Clostridia bacterium]
MLFTSLEFLLLFLPVVIVINFVLPKFARNYWLLLASLAFYAWGEPRFVLVMIGSIVVNYIMALLVTRKPHEIAAGSGGRQKFFLAVAVLLNLGVLFVYKYLNFTTGTLRSAFPGLQESIPQTEFILPIGISFFTFQAMSYVIDVYRGVPVQKNVFNVGLYVSLFPQLIAGPIVRYTTVEKQIRKRKITFSGFSNGVMRFLYGFNKKMLLANTLANVADAAFASTELSTGMAWVGIISYTLQIFYDFCGYSEMAIGLGQMLGFNFLENFNYPYISKTITEFWRRWHISLGSWFRDYVYFPMGGSRVKSGFRLVCNLAVVWLATGVWHGANWTFILWGALYGVIIIFEKLTQLPKRLPRYKLASGIYQIFTLLAVMLGWVLFRAESLTAAFEYLKDMFAVGGGQLIDDAARFNLREYIVPLIVGIVCATPIFKILREKVSARSALAENVWGFAAGLVQLALFMVGISYLVINAHNPFIYFNF